MATVPYSTGDTITTDQTNEVYEALQGNTTGSSPNRLLNTLAVVTTLTDSTAAETELIIDNSTADGDPIISFQLSATNVFTMGVDDGDSDKFKIGTTAIGTSTRMTIDSSGNIGIGTTNPTNALSVEATVSNDFLAEFKQGDSTAGQSFGINIQAGTNSSDYPLRIANQAGTEYMRVGGDGNVGIGETSPLGNLHIKSADASATVSSNADELVVEGSGHSGISILSGSSSSGLIYFADSGSVNIGQISYAHGSNAMSFGTNSSVWMAISSAGVVNLAQLGASLDVQTDGSKNLITSSDKRLKNDLGELKSGLKEILKLKPKYFSWKNDKENKKTLGFMAQDVNPIIPEAAPHDKENDSWGFNTRAVVAHLVKAVQELNNKIEAL